MCGITAGIEGVPSLARYLRHLEATASWLRRSVVRGRGGSAAYFSPLVGWSRPYPETTGYLIPTLLNMEEWLPGRELRLAAIRLGEWLLSIQRSEGAWSGGLYPPRGEGRPSVFNTAQIIKGVVSLYRATGEHRWAESAGMAATWLAEGVSGDGEWRGTDYRSCVTPSYYAHAAWPMLEAWDICGDESVRQAAERVLRMVLSRRQEDGSFRAWAFEPDKPPFTHTIAYTLRGLLESARLLEDWETYGEPVVPALEFFLRRAEFTGGRLPGAYRAGWQPVRGFTCLTGNVQVALCLLIWEQRVGDLRIVNAAAKLVDYVCSTQWLRAPIAGLRGAVAGSVPLWGPYIRFRYPNWAAKYHCDALMMLIRRIGSALER